MSPAAAARLCWLVPALLGLMAFSAVAQDSATLPEKLTGKWRFVAQGKEYGDREWMVFEGSREPGPIKGRLTHYGATCGAQDEPFTGTWDGAVVKFDVLLRSNVNTAYANACKSPHASYVLRRVASEPGFAGTMTTEAGTGSVDVSP